MTGARAGARPRTVPAVGAREGREPSRDSRHERPVSRRRAPVLAEGDRGGRVSFRRRRPLSDLAVRQ